MANDSWIYQGRQYHMWFGSGTKPTDAKLEAASKASLPSLQDRIHNVGHTLAAGLPASKHQHAATQLGVVDHGRLTRVLAGVVNALPLGPRLIAIRVLGINVDAPGIDSFVKAGGILQAADSHADLRKATDLIARSAQEMGLDRFKPFLRKADDYLTQSGGLVTLLREIPKPPISERVTVGQQSANGRAAVNSLVTLVDGGGRPFPLPRVFRVVLGSGQPTLITVVVESFSVRIGPPRVGTVSTVIGTSITGKASAPDTIDLVLR